MPVQLASGLLCLAYYYHYTAFCQAHVIRKMTSYDVFSWNSSGLYPIVSVANTVPADVEIEHGL